MLLSKEMDSRTCKYNDRFQKKASSAVESNLYKLINNGLFGKALMSGGKDVLNQ